MYCKHGPRFFNANRALAHTLSEKATAATCGGSKARKNTKRYIAQAAEVRFPIVKKFSLALLLITISVFTIAAQRVRRGISSVTASTTAVYAGTARSPVASRTPTSTSGRSLRAVERRTFDLINEEREKRGLRPLAWNDDVAQVARLHSRNMAQNNFFSHRGLDGMMVNDRAEEMGLFDWRAIGENIAFNRGYDLPVDLAVEKWLESPSHRENLLNKNWIETGVGVAVSRDGSYYFTQVFILRK